MQVFIDFRHFWVPIWGQYGSKNGAKTESKTECKNELVEKRRDCRGPDVFRGRVRIRFFGKMNAERIRHRIGHRDDEDPAEHRSDGVRARVQAGDEPDGRNYPGRGAKKQARPGTVTFEDFHFLIALGGE